MSVGPLDGLVTGLDTSTLISSLLQVDAQPQKQLQTQQTKAKAEGSAWDLIATRLNALKTATTALAPASALKALTASTSDSTAVRASVTSATSASSLTFRVMSLASAHQSASSSFATTSSLVGAGTITLNDGAQSLGISNIQAGSSVAAGKSTITVSRASSGASLSGQATTFPIIIGAGNATVAVVINGVAKIATLTAGSYTSMDPIAAQLASQFGGSAKVEVSNGALQISTADEGSAATIANITGTAVADLGLGGLDTSSSTGTDGLITYGNTQVAVTSTAAGSTVDIEGTTVTLAGGHLSAGAASMNVIKTTASTTLTDLAAAINASGGSVRASAVATGASGSNAKLILTGTQSGAAHDITVDSGLTSLGSFTTLRAASDAEIKIGDGPSAITLKRSSNTVTDVMAGVSLTLAKADQNTDVTVSTDPDTDGLTSKVKSMIDSLNSLFTTVKSYSSYDSKTGTAGTLLGDSRLTSMSSAIRRSMQTSLSTGTIRSFGQMGIQVQRDGTYSFDADAFTAALETDPTSVTKLLSRQASTTDGRATFLNAGAAATAGTSSLVITQAAERAAVDGNVVGSLAADESLTIVQSGVTTSFTALAGSDADTVAAGLQAVLSSAGLSMTASVVGGKIHLATNGYGSAASFSVTSSVAGAGGTGLGNAAAGVAQLYTGKDVVGSVGGVATTGIGQLLTAASGSGTGLALQITASAADVSGASGSLSLGTVDYTGGLAGTLTSFISSLTGTSGTVTEAKKSATDRTSSLQTSIDEWTDKLKAKQDRYRQQFASLETLIGQLRSQQTSLASQLNSL